MRTWTTAKDAKHANINGCFANCAGNSVKFMGSKKEYPHVHLALLALTTQQLMPYIHKYRPPTQAVLEPRRKSPLAVWATLQGLKAKFDTKATAKEALTDLLKTPDDADLQAVFVQLKKLVVREDAAFGDKRQAR